ncbi:hypothetical protein [Nocardia fluminea]|uniref:hypothetical protein n=1 Tax=Nocardia fluminea TaxID=134984 RepID=UPI0037BAB332
MGEDEIGLRRLEKKQGSREFLAWLAAEADDLAHLFHITPGLADLADPWTVEGLAGIERAAMERMPTPSATATGEEMAYLALCARGIGHTYLRTMGEGRWVWVDLYEGEPPVPALEFPGHTVWTDPGISIRNIVYDRHPGGLAEELQRLADWSRESHKYWEELEQKRLELERERALQRELHPEVKSRAREAPGLSKGIEKGLGRGK